MAGTRARTNGKTTLKLHTTTRDRVKDLIGKTEFWSERGFEIAPGTAEEVVKGLLDIAERQGGSGG